MFAIYRWGDEAQKNVGCRRWRAAKPSGASAHRTRLRKQSRRDARFRAARRQRLDSQRDEDVDHERLESPTWPSCGRKPTTGIRGFSSRRDTTGFTAKDIHRKLSLRASVTSELVLRRLPRAGGCPARRCAGSGRPARMSERGTLSASSGERWAPRARATRPRSNTATTRVQFGRPIGGFQLTQAKLVDMLLELNKGTLLALHLGRLKDASQLRPAASQLRKAQQRPRRRWRSRESSDDPRRKRRHRSNTR